MSAGLYFHIPFCKNKCPYCDFFSIKYDEITASEYTDKICREMKKYSGEFDTIYFGGGTPSIMPAEFIGRIIDCARENFVILPHSEVTVECNPSKDLKNDFVLYKGYGVNRISIGMQSAVDRERFALGRASGREQVEACVSYARDAGIDNISLDLMIGTPKQSLDSLDYTFDFIEKIKPCHISAYMLKIEEGTKFYEMKDRLTLPDEEQTAQMYLKTVSSLEAMGLMQYEISNFARPGYESCHNTKYWTLEPYLGIGASAHSFWQGKRFYYDRNMNITDDGTGGDDEEKIMLGLRLKKGINKSLVKKDYSPFVKMGYITEQGENIALTPKGMLLSNAVICELI